MKTFALALALAGASGCIAQTSDVAPFPASAAPGAASAASRAASAASVASRAAGEATASALPRASSASTLTSAAAATTGGAATAGTKLRPDLVQWVVAHETAALWIAIVVGITLPALPLGAYLSVGWFVRRNEIFDSLSTKARETYLKRFVLSSSRRPEPTAPSRFAPWKSAPVAQKSEFEEFYYRWYGRHHFGLPTLLFFVVLLYVVALLAISARDSFPHSARLGPYDLPRTAVAALAGAYLWVSSDFISRARRLDFSPADVCWGTLRLLIAVPMGYAFSSLAKDAVGPVVAFALGAFPLAKLMDMLRNSVPKLWGAAVSTSPSQADAVLRIQGIDEDVATRLANEGITTILQLAYCDPVRLVMRSSFNFVFICDLMNQALAWLYFQDQMQVLRPLGLRGAVEVADFMEDLNSRDTTTASQAQSTLADVTAAIQPPHTQATMWYTLGQIADDPYTRFLLDVWE